jgi:hypothetical protein
MQFGLPIVVLIVALAAFPVARKLTSDAVRAQQAGLEARLSELDGVRRRILGAPKPTWLEAESHTGKTPDGLNRLGGTTLFDASTTWPASFVLDRGGDLERTSLSVLQAAGSLSTGPTCPPPSPSTGTLKSLEIFQAQAEGSGEGNVLVTHDQKFPERIRAKFQAFSDFRSRYRERAQAACKELAVPAPDRSDEPAEVAAVRDRLKKAHAEHCGPILHDAWLSPCNPPWIESGPRPAIALGDLESPELAFGSAGIHAGLLWRLGHLSLDEAERKGCYRTKVQLPGMSEARVAYCNVYPAENAESARVQVWLVYPRRTSRPQSVYLTFAPAGDNTTRVAPAALIARLTKHPHGTIKYKPCPGTTSECADGDDVCVEEQGGRGRCLQRHDQRAVLDYLVTHFEPKDHVLRVQLDVNNPTQESH